MAGEEAAVVSRGPNFTSAEDLCLAKAWVAASEDPVVGNQQCSDAFKAKMWDLCRALIKSVNDRCGASCPNQTEASAHNRLKKLSHLALKHIGCERAAGDPPSSKADLEEWEKKAEQESFKTHNPDGKNLVSHVRSVKTFLRDHPKWIACKEEDSAATDKKRKCPESSKKAKEKKADKQFVMNCLNTAGNVSLSEEGTVQKKQQRVEKREAFVDSISAVAASFCKNMEDNVDLKLLPCLSPKSKSELAKLLHEKRKNRAGDVLCFLRGSVCSPLTGVGDKDNKL